VVGLAAVQAAVHAAVDGQQALVRARFDDAAVVEHEHAIGQTHGREAVRDQDGGAPARQLA
jgi:hypothetical protein